MTFDRLRYIDRLKIAGVDEMVARAHAEALRDALSETVATKDDLRALGGELRGMIDQLYRKIDDTIISMDRKYDALDRKIDDTVISMDRKFDALDRKIDDTVISMDRKFDALDRKIEITARDLTIKGAGGLVMLAGLMVGLKLFG
jgi:hypothetical protein